MLRQKTRLGKSPSKKKMVRGFPTSNTKNITAQSLNHACHFNFSSFCIDVSCGLVNCLSRGAVNAKKCLPRRLPSLNEPENFVKSLIRIYPLNFRSLGSRCRKGFVTCHARRYNLQLKSCKWATIQIKSKISSASPSFYN